MLRGAALGYGCARVGYWIVLGVATGTGCQANCAGVATYMYLCTCGCVYLDGAIT